MDICEHKSLDKLGHFSNSLWRLVLCQGHERSKVYLVFGMVYFASRIVDMVFSSNVVKELSQLQSFFNNIWRLALCQGHERSEGMDGWRQKKKRGGLHLHFGFHLIKIHLLHLHLACYFDLHLHKGMLTIIIALVFVLARINQADDAVSFPIQG